MSNTPTQEQVFKQLPPPNKKDANARKPLKNSKQKSPNLLKHSPRAGSKLATLSVWLKKPNDHPEDNNDPPVEEPNVTNLIHLTPSTYLVMIRVLETIMVMDDAIAMEADEADETGTNVTT